MPGIITAGGYVPRRRLPRSEIAALFGKGGGRGTRSVASFDEDTTTIGAEAARLALRSAPEGVEPAVLWFATGAPAYLDKTNATAIHAAVRLDSQVPAFDAGTSVRSTAGLLRSALSAPGVSMLVAADIRTGLPTSAEETDSGDGAAAMVIGSSADGPVIAEWLGGWSATEEFVDRWRGPGDAHSHRWEERFGETRYVPLGEEAWRGALKATGVAAGDVDVVVVAGLHARAATTLAKRLDVADGTIRDALSGAVGNTGVAHPLLALTEAIEAADPHQVIALVVLSDGADVFMFRTTDALAHHQPARPVTAQIDAATDVAYSRFLSWRGLVTPEPPNRPSPDRPSSSASARSEDWKYGFVGSRDRSTGAIHLPPARASMAGDHTIDDMDPAPMADAVGTVVTSTVDRLVYSPSPPVVFAVVDFDGGGRMACELTDTDPDEVGIGTRVEMTFRRMFTSPDGIHNYFWKARPVPASGEG